MKPSTTLLCLILLGVLARGLSPTNEILLYPNTAASPSLYLVSFTLTNELSVGEYLLVNMDWLPSSIDPYHCIMVNETVSISCTNLASPSFTLTFTYATMLKHNAQLTDTTTLVVKLENILTANTEHHLQIGLLSDVPSL